MTDKPASPFQPILDIAIDAIGDLASGLVDEVGKTTAKKPGKQDPLVRLVTGFATSQGGGFTGLFDQFVPKPPTSHSEPAPAPPSATSSWSSATDDVRTPTTPTTAAPTPPPGTPMQPDTYPSTRAPRPTHSPGVHVGPDGTGVLKVVPLPNRCANVDCPNKDHEGHFVMVETEGKVVSNGIRGIRLWMCHPCATGLVSTMPDSKGA